jgi:hypothetical protein
MSTPSESPDISLSPEQIAAGVAARLKKYEAMSFLESFAMFMGNAQILELSLKGLLHRQFGVELPTMERWTLGVTANELSQRGLRPDFIQLLKGVVDYRNYIAHELIANEAILQSLLSGASARFELRRLEKGIYELEQLMFLYDWAEEHQGW